MVQVKICGLQDPTHIRVAAEAGADWVGFVLFPNSPRNILGVGEDALESAIDLVRTADAFGVSSVILTVDPDEDLFLQILQDVRPNVIQLHGKEDRDRVQRLWLDCDGEVELWKAISVDAHTEWDAVYDLPVDRLLLDAKAPDESQRPGGNGDPFDWQILQDIELRHPWVLAGGLTPDKVAEAVAATGATAVDVSSGVERAPGVKDEDLIRAFIDAAKSI